MRANSVYGYRDYLRGLEAVVSVLITEYFLSTYTPYTRCNDVIAEAYWMVATLYEILKKAGAEVVVTVSRHLSDLVRGMNTVIVDEGRYFNELELLKDGVDRVLAIAPPTELIAIASLVKDKLIAPRINTLEILSDKYKTATTLERCGLLTPKTIACRGSKECHLDPLQPPLVVKPSMLAGSECVYIASDAAKAMELVDLVARCDPQGYAVLQEYVQGVHGSISAVYSSNTLTLFSLNAQLIVSKGNRLVYHGNVLPIRSKSLVERVAKVLEDLASCLDGLNGYLGLDIVWNEMGIHVVEVNPRFTTSGIGIGVLYPALGEVILGLHRPRNRYLGEEVDGYAYVVKVDLEGCADVYTYINSLRYGKAYSLGEALGIVLRLSPSIAKHLLYDVPLIGT